jgi:hypothetical protein
MYQASIHALRCGREVTAQRRESLSIKQDKFHGEWHYTMQPRT